MPSMEDFLSEPVGEKVESKVEPKKPKTVSNADQKNYLRGIKKRNKYLLENLVDEEKKRIAEYIIKEYNEAKGEHQELCDKLDDWDEVSRLVRKEVSGSGGELPNYRLPISVVAGEVVHANCMNVFFSPKDLMRCLPTAADDIKKVNNVSIFGNWSIKNELDIFNKVDQLFHASGKNGEGVYMIYWKKEYGVEVKCIPIKDDDGNIIYDEETKDPIYQEIEEPTLLYNAPWMEVINRRDYIQPRDSMMGQKPPWEARIVRISYDIYLRDQLQGKYYNETIEKIKDWPATTEKEVTSQDYDGDDAGTPAWSKDFLEWYGGMRINCVKTDVDEQEEVEAYELEDEFIAVVHIKSRTLCAIRKNRFPLKMRPFGIDYLMPDDSGRRAGLGIYELMDPLQKCYDALWNQFINSIDLSNQPIVFFSPTGNTRDEKFKIQRGFAYPTSDPNSVKLFQFPGPNQALNIGMELVQQWAQLLFGISDYAAGIESTIDPSAPAKKAQIIVDQGNVRLNMIIKRKNDVLKDIFKRWFLLYRDNMPKNKFMRIAGEGENDNPWKFEPISYEDFALQSLPDFELTGNILNANKQLEANKAIAIYQMLSTNMFFMPQTQQGLQALRSLTKWLIDKLDDAGLSRFLPEVQNEGILYTAAEENAVMLQGQQITPLPNEDHLQHLKDHMAFINDPSTPEEIKANVGQHIKETIELIKKQMASNLAMQQTALNGPPMPQPGPEGMPVPRQQLQTQGTMNGSDQAAGFGSAASTPGVF
jgi:hypothetical protein